MDGEARVALGALRLGGPRTLVKVKGRPDRAAEDDVGTEVD